MPNKRQSSLVLVGHGSTLNPDSSAPTFQHADEIVRRGLFAEVYCSFWKEEPSLREVLHMVEGDDIYVVPNFISEGYFTETVIPRELELVGPITHRSGKIIKYCEPVGNDPRMVDLLLHRAREAAANVPLEKTSLLIVGHGTSLNEKSAEAAESQARAIRGKGLYAEVLQAYMEEAPFVADWRKNTSQPNVVVVPFFIADGLHSYQDIPVLLGIESAPTLAASQQEVFRRNPYRLDGRALYYASAIGTEPLMADAILDTIERFDRKHLSTQPHDQG
jgi:sirohydrochlorin cobaltochelatase